MMMSDDVSLFAEKDSVHLYLTAQHSANERSRLLEHTLGYERKRHADQAATIIKLKTSLDRLCSSNDVCYLVQPCT